jgi:predicted Ser/Thr protein kinase
MLPDEKIGCHRLPRRCRDGVVDQCCQLWTNVRGRDPQTGVEMDRWGCADAFVPMLLIEVAQQSRQTGAAVESFRNETVKVNERAAQERRETLNELLSGQPRRQAIG